ncbi:MAG: RNA ligase family protein [Candidatus Parvarchaeum sp.]
MRKYPKVLLSEAFERNEGMEKGEFYIEEKVDGSQFRFGIDEEGVKHFGSKSVDYTETRLPEVMFKKAVESATEALEKYERLKGEDSKNTYFFAEYLKSPKQNTLVYERVPQGNLIVFDIIYHGAWVRNIEELTSIANAIGLEGIQLFRMSDHFPTLEEAKSIIANGKSILGGNEIEGIVVKNYDILIEMYGDVRPLFYKLVKEGFREMNAENWKREQKKLPAEEMVLEMLNTKVIYNKAVQHLQEEGERLGEMKDIVKLIELVKNDLYTEYVPEIKEVLWNAYKEKIERMLLRGLAPYYKERLYTEMQEKLTGSPKEK